MLRRLKLQIIPGLFYEVIADTSLELHPGSEVVVQCEHYQEFGTIHGFSPQPPAETADEWERERAARPGRRLEGAIFPRVLRLATAEDREARQDRIADAESHRKPVLECIRETGLQLHLVSLHWSLDRKMLLCTYQAEKRIDFRTFIRTLGMNLLCHVEMRQIGAREAAACQGGLGICGRRLCCNVFLQPTDLQRSAFTMPAFAGLCGKSRCCMHFEDDKNTDPCSNRGSK